MKYRFLIILSIFLGLFISFRTATRDYKLDFKISQAPTAGIKYLSPPADYDELPHDKKCCRHAMPLHVDSKPATKETRKLVIRNRTSQPHTHKQVTLYTWLSSVLDINPLDQTVFSVSLQVGT